MKATYVYSSHKLLVIYYLFFLGKFKIGKSTIQLLPLANFAVNFLMAF